MCKLLLACLPRKLRLELEYRRAKRKVESAWLRTHPECAACGRTVNVTVHRILPPALKPSLALDPHNFITLCQYPCELVFGCLLNHHCYNRDVVALAEQYRRAVRTRRCLPLPRT